jgi:hypothetical protein
MSLGRAGVADANNNIAAPVNRPIIAPYWTDMSTNTSGYIHYKLLGNAPNRIAVIEWKVRPSLTNTYHYFQVWLHETSGRIEFVYFQSPAIFYTYSIGIGANLGQQYSYASVSVGSPVFGSFATYSSANNGNSFPIPDSTCFRFQPDTALSTGAKNILLFPQSGCLAVQWTDSSSNESYFDLMRSTDSLNFTRVFSVTSSDRPGQGQVYVYQDTFLRPFTRYFYRVETYTLFYSENDSLRADTITQPRQLSGIKTIPGDFVSITDALSEIKCKLISSDLILELQPGYQDTAEIFPIVFNKELQTAAGMSLTIRPASTSSNLNISSGSLRSTLIFDSAVYVNFDGRPGGSGASRELSVENSGANSSSVLLKNDSRNIHLDYCTFRANADTSNEGVVTISGSSAQYGNDSIFITGSMFKPLSSPVSHYIFSGNDSTLNDHICVKRCEFVDIGSSNNFPGSSICLAKGSSEWTIEGNHFYQALNTNQTIYQKHSLIRINSLNGSGFIIRGNCFGGRAPNCIGNYYSVSGAIGSALEAVFIQAGNNTVTRIDSNTFANFYLANMASGNCLLCLDSGNFDVGGMGGNQFGRMDTINSIYFSTIAANWMAVVRAFTYAPVKLTGNKFGGIFCDGASSTADMHMIYGMLNKKFDAVNNIIGSDSISNSIYSTSPGMLLGIYSGGHRDSSIIRGNRITNLRKNCTNQGQGNNYLRPIYVYDGAIFFSCRYVIDSNVVSHIGITGYGEARGIETSTSVISQVFVNHNLIHSLSYRNHPGGYLYGIYCSNHPLDTLQNELKGNLIHSFTAGGAAGYGAYIYQGKYKIYNNMIRMGIDSSGSTSSGQSYTALECSSTTTEDIDHNTLFIAGTIPVFSGSSCLLLSPGSNVTVKVLNNIFCNEASSQSGNDACLTLYNYTSAIQSNYNLFYNSSPSGRVGYISSLGYTTLAQWQAGSGKDASSLFANPLLTNGFAASDSVDLHLTLGSPAEGSGTLVPWVVDDYDAQLRSVLSPVDIGADAGNYLFVSSSEYSKEELTVFPDPTHDILYTSGSVNGSAQLFVSDIAGRLVKKEEMKDGVTGIIVSELPPGIYFIKIITGQRTYCAKFSKI